MMEPPFLNPNGGAFGSIVGARVAPFASNERERSRSILGSSTEKSLWSLPITLAVLAG